jgi:transcriptional regulator with XRE-family HTH domain
MNFEQLLDEARLALNESTDSGLARRLGVKRQTVSNWRTGTNLPDVVTCEKLAKITGKTPLSVIASVSETREKSRDAKAVWRRIAAAAVVILATGFTALPSQAADDLNATANMHYAKLGGLARFLSRQLRRMLFGQKMLEVRHGSPTLLAA